MLEHDSDSTAPLSIAVRAKEAGATGGVALPESPLAPDQDPYYLQQKAFMEALSKGQPPPVTAHDAREAVRIALAAMESVETGKVVQLS
jgi:predicted dehydrogenase